MSLLRWRFHSGFPPLILLVLLGFAAEPSPAPAQTFAAFDGVAVGAASPADVSRLTDAGVLSLKGPGTIFVTIAGEMKSRADRDGTIGVLFLPDLPFFDALYRFRRILLASSEFTAPVSAGESSYFISPSKRVEAGFSRYRLLLYNTTGASASVNVYVGAARN